MFDKMKQLMEMKKQADQIKRELDALTIEYNDVAGIDITLNGAQEFQSIKIEEHLLGVEHQEKLQTEILRSVNGAIKKSQAVAAQRMKDALPGFPGM